MEGVAPADAAGLEERFRALYVDALPRVFGFLSVRTGGDRELTEDLTAETFAAAVDRYRGGRADEVTISWLITVARRRLVDHWRRVAVADQKLVLLGDGVEAGPEIGERELILGVLGSLPAAQRTALVLQHLEDMSVREIAEVIGKTEKATESLLARARRAFRSGYEEVAHG